MAGHFFCIHGTVFMTVREIQNILESWAPREIAWEKDNVGLQVGSPDQMVRSITVCLDVSEGTVREAIAHKSNLLVSHHPLLFRPVRSINLTSATGRCIARLLESGTTLLSSHTNLDFTRGGTSFALAEQLGLRKIDFLRKTFKLSRKVVTFVPATHVDRVAQAMADAGAGRIGNYDTCSFRTVGTGTFRGNGFASPAIGEKGRLEQTDETRIEMIVEQPRLDPVLRAMKNAHPYEEVAYDIYPLENASRDYGMGALGELARPVAADEFKKSVMKNLRVRGIRCSRPRPGKIRRVAVCGGSGADLTDDALRAEADAFVTADVKYHAFQEADGQILLMDAGHYETERPVVDAVVQRLLCDLKSRGIGLPVRATRTSSNPIVYN
jgi:dinuclear metal center YbgI/SA1388 family protein